MKQPNLMLLTGLTTAGVLAGGVLAPANAAYVTYSLFASFGSDGFVKGTFDYDAVAGGNNYINVNLVSSAKAPNFVSKTYSSTSSGNASGLTSLNATSPTGILSLAFATALTSTGGSAISSGSEFQVPGGVFTRNITSGAVAVPFDTPALPVLGSTLLFGFGIWAKNKKGQAKKVDLSA